MGFVATLGSALVSFFFSHQGLKVFGPCRFNWTALGSVAFFGLAAPRDFAM